MVGYGQVELRIGIMPYDQVGVPSLNHFLSHTHTRPSRNHHKITLPTNPPPSITTDILVCNGPGVCVPTVLGVVLMNTLPIPFLSQRCPIVFIESICRTKKLSLTGRLMRSMSTYFFVHYEKLLQQNPKAMWLSSPELLSRYGDGQNAEKSVGKISTQAPRGMSKNEYYNFYF